MSEPITDALLAEMARNLDTLHEMGAEVEFGGRFTLPMDVALVRSVVAELRQRRAQQAHYERLAAAVRTVLEFYADWQTWARPVMLTSESTLSGSLSRVQTGGIIEALEDRGNRARGALAELDGPP